LDSLKLLVRKDDLTRALRVLSSNRRGIVPIWLDYDGGTHELRLWENRRRVLAILPAIGTWPPTRRPRRPSAFSLGHSTHGQGLTRLIL
jgi:hypothetical protein